MFELWLEGKGRDAGGSRALLGPVPRSPRRGCLLSGRDVASALGALCTALPVPEPGCPGPAVPLAGCPPLPHSAV